MINIDTVLDKQGVIRAEIESPIRVSAVKVSKTVTAEQSHLGKPDEEWGWREVRDYVVTEIEQRFGSFPRIPYKEQSIFQRFVKDWGVKAPAIARYAFEVVDGMWRGKPIEIGRFAKGSDPYFAVPISKSLLPEDALTDW